MNISNIKLLLSKSKITLQKKFFVKKIGVFGSYLRGEQKKTSDIDILVEFYEDPSLFKFLDLKYYLEDVLKHKVDLVMKNSLKPNIGRHILSEVIYI